MADFIVTNLTDQNVDLPSPVSFTLAPHQSYNLGDPRMNIPGEYLVIIKHQLSVLEQTGKISIQGVPDTEADIEEAADEAGYIHPMVIKDAMAEERALQIPAWNGTAAMAGSPKTMKLCITDDGGSPSLIGTHTPTMTLTVSGVTNAKVSSGSSILPGATDSAEVTISEGMATFTIQGDAGTMDIVVTGTAPVNPVTGETLMIINDSFSPYQVVIS